MILTPAENHPVRAALDDLFRRALARRPDALALIDPPDRATVTDGAPRALTYAEADRAISALAATLRSFGLPADSVVALQLPNTVESVIALLGVLRAGMIAAPLPLLWREKEAAAALGSVGARALIGCRQIGEADYGTLAMQLAAETFTIRFVGAFGNDLPDGIVPLDDIFAGDAAAEPPALTRNGEAADHIAVVTFDVTQDGIVPAARSHAALIAGGLGVHLEARIETDASLIGALALPSFAGLATTLAPWLLSGGTLALHHPFAPATLAAQRSLMPDAITVLPGALAARLADAGLIGDARVLAVWRTPERMAGSAPWTGSAPLVDVAVFGETGLIAALREDDAPALPSGRIALPRGARDGIHVLDAARSAASTLLLSGPMTPQPFPSGAAPAATDTLYPCRIDATTGRLTIEGPPTGLVNVGGYRFALLALQDLVAGIEDGTLAALPDTLAGHRLAGTAADRNAICDALLAQGANPLVVAAFRPRRSGGHASAA
jgi:hypothetical protein